MLPIRTKWIFQSRWIALLWAGGIIWAAVDFTGGSSPADDGEAATTDATGAPIDADRLKQTQALLKTIGG